MSGRSLESWYDLSGAPKTGEPVVLLVYFAGKPRPYVGRWHDGGWQVFIPLSSDHLSVSPKKWSPLPAILGASG
jgi:hypothetical protein